MLDLFDLESTSTFQGTTSCTKISRDISRIPAEVDQLRERQSLGFLCVDSVQYTVNTYSPISKQLSLNIQEFIC